MPLPSPDIAALVDRYALALEPPRRGGLAGERLGHGTGSSLEFEDRRDYVPGDDVRHIDWRALARTGEVMVRTYRDEILPRVEVLVDGSASMAVDEEKAERAVDLASLIGGAARADGNDVALVTLGDGVRPVPLRAFDGEGLALEGRRPLVELLESATSTLRSGAARVLITDGIVPTEPAAVVRRLVARAAGSLCVLQVLGSADLRPEVGAACRLTDAETGATIDRVLDERSVSRYRKRLDALVDAWRQELRRVGGRHVLVDAGVDLDRQCRDVLCNEGILQPR